MATRTLQYTLVGFGENLDWKPLHFVKPIPRNRQCSVCGLVRKTTALLPCGHVACDSCYEQCGADDGNACLIDRENFLEEDVEWRDFPTGKLLQREVTCWNHGSGCMEVMAVSEVSKHFHTECEYHCTPCPRCSATVLCSYMREHLGANCHTLTVPDVTESDKHLVDVVERGSFTDLERALEERAGEIKALLERAFSHNGAICDSLTELSQTINSLKESVSQNTRPVGRISDEIQRILNDISTLHEELNIKIADAKMHSAQQFFRFVAAVESAKEHTKVSNNAVMQKVEEALAHTKKNVNRCEFFVREVKSHEAAALEKGFVTQLSGPVYLRGYNISPGVTMKNNKESSMSLFIALKLHRGDLDEVVQWPFEHQIKLTILHPLQDVDKSITVKTSRSLKNYGKPTESSDEVVDINHKFIDLGELKCGGYVCDDELRVVWELL
ncbi:TNF receptor-associated factor 6-like [Dermacentor variabilis]|uniref:TNF receptor-associated factor 6-like n=1 Tax=Dermacentor variabilis TaxID=34621 RepID=UPI003F5CAD82